MSPSPPAYPDPMREAIAARLQDGGPRYLETDLDRLIVEPWNAVSALLFVGIVIYWLIRLHGRYSRYPFLALCLPILAAGGLGGTLYHATRASRAFFLMDVLPIVILCLATSAYLWGRLLPKWWYGLALLLPYFAIQRMSFLFLQGHQAINFSYASLAVLILLPTIIYLPRTHFRHGIWVGLGVVCFAAALYFRYADPDGLLPMGTHWLWHTFGAAACWAVSEFLYRLEGDTQASGLRNQGSGVLGVTPDF